VIYLTNIKHFYFHDLFVLWLEFQQFQNILHFLTALLNAPLRLLIQVSELKVHI